jgi:MoaA/NifB/PqqE/SkfB family radical SAM enzyme
MRLYKYAILFGNRPKNIFFELTNRCNLRCRMCSIWKEYPKRDFDLGLFRKVMEDGILANIKSVVLTGGEPFMASSLKRYYSVAREHFPHSFVDISTNGYLNKKMFSFLQHTDVSRLSITISYDGLNSHNSIRRPRKSKNEPIETAKMIRQEYPKIPLTLKFTITPWNYQDIVATALFAKELDIPMHFKMMEELRSYYNRLEPLGQSKLFRKEIRGAIIQQLKTLSTMNIPINKRYVENIIRAEPGKSQCMWPKTSLFVCVDGKVYLCRKKKCIGDLNSNSMSEIFESSQMRSVADSMHECKEKACFSYHP